MRTAPPTVPGMLTPNSMPLSPACAARADTAGRRAPPAAANPGPVEFDRAQLLVQLEDQSADARVRHQEVRPRSDDTYLDPLGGRPGQEALEVARASRGGRTARPSRRCGSWSAGPADSRAALRAGTSGMPRQARWRPGGRGLSEQRAPQRVDVAGAHHQAEVSLAQDGRRGTRGRPRTSASTPPAARPRRPPRPPRPGARRRPGSPRHARAPGRPRAPPRGRRRPAHVRTPGPARACASRGGAGTPPPDGRRQRPGGGDRRGDLGRMVRVVVVDRHAAGARAEQLEPPSGAAEVGQRGGRAASDRLPASAAAVSAPAALTALCRPGNRERDVDAAPREAGAVHRHDRVRGVIGLACSAGRAPAARAGPRRRRSAWRVP